MIVTTTTTTTTRPLMGALLRTRMAVLAVGGDVQEWRVHPIGAMVLRRQMQRRAWTGSLELLEPKVLGRWVTSWLPVDDDTRDELDSLGMP